MSVLLPALGPRLVFFTGGTALRGLSRSLTRYTHNSVHLVTPFDSGGSSAALREAFALPAVGDIRNRLAALADSMVPQSVLDFWEMRLPAEGDSEALRARLRAMGSAGHPCWRPLPPVMADVMRVHLGYFLERMPDDFRPQKASMGNLLLAGGYLHFQRNFTPVLSLFSRLLQVRGVVLPIVNACLHLAAELADGSVLVGQHHFCRLTQPVRRLYLTVHEPGRTSTALTPCRPPLSATAATYLQSAGAICYPMGSFYTSVLSNLLPDGVGRAVAAARCPKIYIPNSGRDTEAQGLSLTAQVDMLLRAPAICCRPCCWTAATGATPAALNGRSWNAAASRWWTGRWSARTTRSTTIPNGPPWPCWSWWRICVPVRVPRKRGRPRLRMRMPDGRPA